MQLSSLRRSLFTCAALAFVASSVTPALGQEGTIPPGGHYRECHGYVRHVSTTNIRVHCIDGNPADLSFLYGPNFKTFFVDGKSVQTKDLTPDTPVHIIFTQSLGIRKASKIFVADPSGHGLYGFKS